jgi:transposase-like protein
VLAIGIEIDYYVGMKKNPKSPILDALRNATINEQAAVIFFEQQRWGNEPGCPRCGDVEVYPMKSASGERNKDYRWRCRGCKSMYTVRTDTVFEESRLPLRIWAYAFWKACSSKKGISALQLSREMEITHKSALYVLRRIRHGVGSDNARKLTGTVEVDETYVGGKPRYRRTRHEQKGRSGRGTDKAAVLGMVERGGDVRFRMMDRLTSERLREVIAENADLTCRIITDELTQYRRLGMEFEGGHAFVKHSAGEYVKLGTDIHSNSVEGVFSLLKRGVYGTFHSVSKKHLPNYLNEFEFRFNTRKCDDGERVTTAIQMSEGKRLEYRESVDNPPYLVTGKNG